MSADRRLPAAFLLALALAACHQADEPAPAPPPPPPLPRDEVLLPRDSSKRAYLREETLQAQPAPVSEPVAGKIAYDESRTAFLRSPIPGRVISPIPPLGKLVKAGEVLVELDSPELGRAKEEHANAKADLHLAEESFRRAEMLFEGGVLPRREFQQAEDNLARNRNEVQRTRLRLRSLGVDDTEIDDRYFLRSAVAGTITERHISPGMEVRPDLDAPLFVVSDLHSVWVLLNVFEKDLNLIAVGKKVLVSVPAWPDRRFPAVVEYIDKVLDEATRTVRVRCRAANPDGKLLPAMFATVELEPEPARKALIVPLTALFTEGEGDQVFVRLGDGHYRRQDVKVGLRLRGRAVIAAGLKPGDTIVTEGALLLRTEEANEQEAPRGAQGP